MTGGGETDVRHVKTGENAHDGHLHRLGNIHGLHIAVGNGGAHDPENQRALVAEVIGVFGPAGRLVKGVDTNDTFTDIHSTKPS